MKVLIFGLLFAFVAFTQSQEPTPGEETTAAAVEGSAFVLTCLNGTGSNVSEVVCDFGQTPGACQTKFEIRTENGTQTYFKIERECKQLQACENNAAGNVPKCFPGENNVRQCFFCCTANNCNDQSELSDYALIQFSAPNIRSESGPIVEVDPGFKSAMDNLNSFAQTCNVTVLVLHSFERRNINQTLVPLIPNSNHLVGHALDFSLDTPIGPCVESCLFEKKNRYADCFTQRVTASKLRWGGNFSPPDPGHIDDGLNVRDFKQWQILYDEFQDV